LLGGYHSLSYKILLTGKQSCGWIFTRFWEGVYAGMEKLIKY